MSSERHPKPQPDEASLHGPTQSSRIPPSEPGPYEDEPRPAARSRRPTLTGNLLYYGGAGILAAAATAAVVLAARRLTERDKDRGADDRPARERPLAPRFAELDEAEREEIRRRAREQARADQNRAARLRAMAARDRAGPRRNLAREVTETADNLSGSIHGVMGALTSALTGFRQVAEQAGGIMRDFSDAADAVRGLMDRPEARPETTRNDDAPNPGEAASSNAVPDERPRDRMHRL